MRWLETGGRLSLARLCSHPVFLRKADELRSWLESQAGVTRAISIIDVLKATHKSLNGDKAEFYALPATADAVAQELLLFTMGLPQGMDVNDRITVGNDAIRMTVLNSIATSRDSVAFVAATEARGKELGLKVEATGKTYLYQQTNEYVVFAGGVLLRIIGQPLDMGTVLVASVCLGISIDDTSHVFYRPRARSFERGRE